MDKMINFQQFVALGNRLDFEIEVEEPKITTSIVFQHLVLLSSSYAQRRRFRVHLESSEEQKENKSHQRRVRRGCWRQDDRGRSTDENPAGIGRIQNEGNFAVGEGRLYYSTTGRIDWAALGHSRVGLCRGVERSRQVTW